MRGGLSTKKRLRARCAARVMGFELWGGSYGTGVKSYGTGAASTDARSARGGRRFRPPLIEAEFPFPCPSNLKKGGKLTFPPRVLYIVRRTLCRRSEEPKDRSPGVPKYRRTDQIRTFLAKPFVTCRLSGSLPSRQDCDQPRRLLFPRLHGYFAKLFILIIGKVIKSPKQAFRLILRARGKKLSLTAFCRPFRSKPPFDPRAPFSPAARGDLNGNLNNRPASTGTPYAIHVQTIQSAGSVRSL